MLDSPEGEEVLSRKVVYTAEKDFRHLASLKAFLNLLERTGKIQRKPHPSGKSGGFR
jgi:hypothetical protein